MAALLLIPPLFGWLVTRRILQEGDRLTAVLLAPALGIAFLLFGANTAFHYVDLSQSLLGTLGIMLLASAALLARREEEPLRTAPLDRWTLVGLALMLACIYLFTNAQQIASQDDDYWIHAPLQGMMLHGSFPPSHPFIPGLPLHGHYGRDLFLVSLAHLSGLDLFRVQFLATTALQLADFLLFFAVLYRFTGSRLQAFLGAGFMFWGINVGGRGGLLDTMQNNNPLVHLYLPTMLYLVMRAWESGRVGVAVVGAFVLAGFAVVYETHFGLVVLALGSITVLLAAWPGPDRLPLRGAVVALLIPLFALPLSVTQGGAIASVAKGLRPSAQATEARGTEDMSLGMASQTQLVKITFPKKDLFQIYLAPGQYQRISYVYMLDTFLNRFYRTPRGEGYRPIWSWDVLQIHWLPLLLAPLTLVVLLVRRHRAGLLLFAFGTFAYLTPALVDFGPVFEGEYFRWQFAAGLGFTGALGLAAGTVFDALRKRWPGPLLQVLPEPGRFEVRASPAALAAVALGALVVLNSMVTFHYLRDRLESIPRQGGLVQGALLPPSTPRWLARLVSLDFAQADWEAGSWLFPRVQKGDHLLSNFPETASGFESTLVGTTGTQNVGHAVPLDDEPPGTPPFHRSPPARAFWSDLDEDALRSMGVRWIYYRHDHGRPGLDEDLARLPGVTRVFDARDPSGQRRTVYSVNLAPLRAGVMEKDEAPLRAASLQVEGLPLVLRRGETREARVVLENATTEPVRIAHGVIFMDPVRRRDGRRTIPSDRVLRPLDLDLGPGQEATVRLPVVAPLEEGEYDLEIYVGDARAVRRVPGTLPSLEVADRSAARALRLEALVPAGTPDPSRVERFTVTLAAEPDGKAVDEEVLAAVVPFDTVQKLYPIYPGRNLVKVRVSVPPGGRQTLEIPGAVPRAAGHYRLDLMILSPFGWYLGLPGQYEVEVKP